MKRRYFALCLFTLLAIVLTDFVSVAKSPKKKVVQDPDLLKREYMVKISRELGVTCTYCHNVQNFRSKKMRTHKVAIEHMRITQLLNTKGFKGTPKVSCYLCHQGKAKPNYKPKH